MAAVRGRLDEAGIIESIEDTYFALDMDIDEYVDALDRNPRGIAERLDALGEEEA